MKNHSNPVEEKPGMLCLKRMLGLNSMILFGTPEHQKSFRMELTVTQLLFFWPTWTNCKVKSANSGRILEL
jgi:hypothetical protein